MSYQAFNVDISDGVAHVIMSRPDSFNVMDGAYWAEIREIFETLSDKPEVHAVVVL